MTVPTHPDAFTTAWLEASLGAPAGSLRQFSARAVGTGQMSKSFRLTLGWSGDQGPPSIIAKCPATDPGTRAVAAAARCYTLELGWYRELAKRIDVACPQCLHLESADDDQDFALLLEDLSPARQGDQLAGASVGQIEAALRQAARLHAPYWGSERIHEFSWLRPSQNSSDMIRMLLPALFAKFRERYAGRLAPEILEMGDAFVSRLDRYMNRTPAAPTVQHRDFRIDNILFSPSGDHAYVVDWQTLGIGSGTLDVAYLIGTSIADPQERASEEQRLVQFYADELGAREVRCDLEQLWQEYRLYAFSSFLMAIFAAMTVERTERGDEMFAVMAERPARQALDLDSLSLL